MNRKIKIQWLIPVLLVSLFVYQLIQQPTFIGKEWILTAYKGGSEERTLTKVKFHLTFYSLFHFVKIDSGCRRNALFKYTINSSRIRIYNPAPGSDATMDRCIEFYDLFIKDYIDYRDSKLLSSVEYSLRGSELILTLVKAKRKQLVFTEAKNKQQSIFIYPYLVGQQILVILSIIANLVGTLTVFIGLIALAVFLLKSWWQRDKPR